LPAAAANLSVVLGWPGGAVEWMCVWLWLKKADVAAADPVHDK
jgi:hypothetical protein